MSTKHQLLLKAQKDIKAEELQSQREAHAKSLLDGIFTSSTWLQKRKLNYLSIFLDINFVRKTLIELYKQSGSSEIKQIIRSLHDGRYDNSELLSEIENIKNFESQPEITDKTLELKKDDWTSKNILLKKNSANYI